MIDNGDEYHIYQAGAEERELPDVDEGDSGACVDAEDAHAGERRDHAREEGEEVRKGGDLDRIVMTFLTLDMTVMMYMMFEEVRQKCPFLRPNFNFVDFQAYFGHFSLVKSANTKIFPHTSIFGL